MMELCADYKTVLLSITAAALVWAYLRVRTVYSYFRQRGIPYVEPVFLLGSDVRGALTKDCMGEAIDRIYQQLKTEKVGGCFLGLVPTLVITDPEYAHRLMITSFDHFHDRPFLIDEEVNPLEAHLFFLRGNKWRFLRNKLSPVFTSGKLKYMYDEMAKCSESLIQYLDQFADGRDMDLNETLANFSTDVIGSTAFGLEPECMKNPDSEFRAMGRKFFEPTFRNAILFFLRFAAPRLVIAMKLRTTEKVVSDYFLSLIKQVFKFRREKSVVRNDFIQLSLQLKEKGFIAVDSAEMDQEDSSLNTNERTIEKFDLSDDLLAAQSFLFFLAGFETTALTMHWLLYLLSVHEPAQTKVREEILAAKHKYGQFNYQAVSALTYLDKCIAETLRMFPPVTLLFRECTKEYEFPNGVKVEAGMQVLIPAFSFQRDSKYFPGPEEFRPERFETAPPRGSYIPFGDGPRICIGKRFALVEMKCTVARLLSSYRLQASSLTKTPLEFATSITLSPRNPLYVRLSRCHFSR